MGDENDPNASQVDCYRVKIPFYLATEDTSIDTIEAYEMNIAIQFDYKNTSTSDYPPIEVVDVEIPTQTSGGAPFNSGFTFFELSGSNYFFIQRNGGSLSLPATFEVNQPTPSFYAIVDVRHLAFFEAKVVSLDENPTQFTLINDGFTPATTLCEFEDIEIQGNDKHRGPLANFCDSATGADDIRVKIDLDNIIETASDISNEQGQLKQVPVKLVSLSGDPGSINLSRLDFKIDYSDVEGEMDISTSPLQVLGLGSIFPEVNYNESYIGVNLSESDLNEINFIFDPVSGSSTYEAVLFFITVEAPTNPPAAGEIEFTGDYARLKYDGGPCCLPQFQGGGTLLLEEFERYCGNNTDSYIEIAPLNETLEEDEVGLDVRIHVVDDPALSFVEYSQMYLEVEVVLDGEGVILDETEIETVTDISCPNTCADTDFNYPSSGCIELVPGTNIIRYGFCSPRDIGANSDFRLFKILATGGTSSCSDIRSVKINRATWTEEDNTICVPTIIVNNHSPKVSTEGIVYAHCGSSGQLVAGIKSVQISKCQEDIGDESQTGGSFEYCYRESEASTSLSATKDGDALDGVSTIDLVIISKHLMGVGPLEYPWQYIAADVNESETISVLDLIQIKKRILSIETEFSPVNWRFLGENYTLPGTPNPFITSFQYSDLDCFNHDFSLDQTPSFSAIKKGDVNGSIFQICDSTENYTGNFEIQGKNNTTPAHVANGQVAVGAIASGSAFSDVLGFQVTLRFDTSKLTFDTLLAKDLGDVDDEVYHLDHNEPDLLRISWFAENGTARDLSSTEQAFELVFDLNSGSALSFSDVWIDTTEMAPELYVERDSTIDSYRLTLGSPASGFLIQAPGNGQLPASQPVAQELTVLPNPSSGDFTVKALPQATAPARLQVLDSSGKLLLDREADLSSDWQLPAQGWPAGLYLLRAEVDGERYTARLVKQ